MQTPADEEPDVGNDLPQTLTPHTNAERHLYSSTSGNKGAPTSAPPCFPTKKVGNRVCHLELFAMSSDGLAVIRVTSIVTQVSWYLKAWHIWELLVLLSRRRCPVLQVPLFHPGLVLLHLIRRQLLTGKVAFKLLLNPFDSLFCLPPTPKAFQLGHRQAAATKMDRRILSISNSLHGSKKHYQTQRSAKTDIRDLPFRIHQH